MREVRELSIHAGEGAGAPSREFRVHRTMIIAKRFYYLSMQRPMIDDVSTYWRGIRAWERRCPRRHTLIPALS